MKSKHIISFGRGVNSWAMVTLLVYKLKVKIDEVVIALTGEERTETEEHSKKFEEAIFNKLGIKITYVYSKLGNIYDWHFERNIIPFVSRRECTDKFKITPIKEYIKKTYPNDIVFMYIGYDYDEPNRVFSSYHKIVKKTGEKKTKSHNTPYIMEYPLFQHKITRTKCIELIKMLGVTPPPKSRCWFCPFQKEEGFRELYLQHPYLYEKALLLEENGNQFPKSNLLNKRNRSLRELKAEIIEQKNLLRFIEIPKLLLEYKK